MKKVNVGFIGLGARGHDLLRDIVLEIEHVDVVAVCDGYEDRARVGAEIVKTPRDKVAETIKNTLAELKKTGKPYFVPGGGHGNIGTEAYVGAYKEILEYEKENGNKDKGGHTYRRKNY